MKPAVFAALLGMAAPAALLAQTATPPTEPAVTGAMPAGDAAGSSLNGATAAGASSGAAAPGAGEAAGSQNPVVMPHSEAAPAPATGPAAATATPAATPQDFVNQAASSGMFEVQSSELALERAGSDAVKGFAGMMVRDHGALNEQLKAVAAAKGLTVPAGIAGPPARHMEAVMEAEGDSFDRAYLDHQAQAHAEAIALFEPWAARTDDTDLAALAQKAVQHIRTHQETLEKLRAD